MPLRSTDISRTPCSNDKPTQSQSIRNYEASTTNMTTATQTIAHHPFSPTQSPSGRRPTLPPPSGFEGPLVFPPTLGPSCSPTNLSTSPYLEGSRPVASDARSSIPSQHASLSQQALPESQQIKSAAWGPGTYQSYQRLQSQDPFMNPLKRPLVPATQPMDRYPPQQMSPTVFPTYKDPASSPPCQTYPQVHLSTRNSRSGPLMPSRTHSFTSVTSLSSISQQALPPHDIHTGRSRSTNSHRFSLHLRQQPRAARAGPDGKDRRAIDPPPVLQLMLSNFDFASESDMSEIKSTSFVVHCKLVSPHLPKIDVSTLASQNDDGSIEIQRLLLGTTVSSPFFCADDPDLGNMPEHPKTTDPSQEAPPSPTNRFIQKRPSIVSDSDKGKTRSRQTPGSFFIFPDLSVRKAGEYRLEFSLMKMDDESMEMGGRLPVITKVTSQIFRVVNAKDFDQVQPSTELVKGLLDRGAGFPLKLKKGTREMSGRRRGDGNSMGSEDDEGESEGQ